MASRVNTKFVVWTGLILAVIVGAVAYVGIRMVNSSGEQNITRGEEAEKAGDLKKAIDMYGRAVNKDRGRVEWIKKWMGAIEKYTPPTRKAYEDMYLQSYLGAIRALCDADRSNPEPYRRWLEEQYRLAQQTPPAMALARWEFLANEYENSVTKKYRGSEESKSTLVRYRGLAKANALERNPDMADDDVNAAVKDLDIALKANPQDMDAALGESSMKRALADRAAKAAHQSEADRLNGEAKTLLEEFAKANPDALRVRLSLLMNSLSEAMRQKKVETIEIVQSQPEGILALAAAIKSAPPEKVDPMVVRLEAQLLLMIKPTDPGPAEDLFESVKKGHATDPLFLTVWSLFELEQTRYDRAFELACQIENLRDRPVSLDGFLLYSYRDRAVQREAEATFAHWSQLGRDAAKMDATAKAEALAKHDEQAKQAESAKKDALAKMEDLVKKLGVIRDNLADRTGKSDPEVLAINGRLAYMTNDLRGARTLVSEYNDKTQRGNSAMLMLEAELLARLGDKGAAKTVYERVVQIDPRNPAALRDLGVLELEMQDYKSAAVNLGMASQLVPDNADLKDLAAKAKTMAVTGDDDDPVVRAVVDASRVAQGLNGDIEEAKKILRAALVKSPGESRLSFVLAQYLLSDTRAGDLEKNRAEARKVLQDSVATGTKDPRPQHLLDSMDKDPVQATLDMINASAASDAGKNLMRWNVYMQARRPEDARKALAEAVRLEPDNSLVVDAQFDDAMFRMRDAQEKGEKAGSDAAAATMDTLAARAQTLNLDRVGGQMYRARALAAQSKPQEAIVALRDVLDKDKLNQMAWRMLGASLIQTGKVADAVDPLTKAVDIKPDDVTAINLLIMALVQSGRAGDALALARKSEPVATGNSDFVEALLQLEETAPGGDKNRAIQARENIAKRVPNNRPNQIKLATLLIGVGRLDDAEKIITKLVAEDAQDFAAVQANASLYAAKNNLPGAVKAMKDFVASVPEAKKTDELYIGAAQVLRRVGATADSRQMLEEGRKYQDKRMLIDREIGDVMFEYANQAGDQAEMGKRLDDSIVAYQRVLDGGAADGQNLLRKRIIEACLKAKRYDEMAKMIDKLPAGAQSDPTVILLQAEAAAAQSDFKKAQRLYDQVIATDPKNPIGYLKRGDFRFRQAGDAMDSQLVKDAQADYEQAINVDKHYAVARVSLANLLRQTGHDDLAVAKLREAVGDEPRSEQLRALLGHTLDQMGRFADAGAVYEEGMKAFPSSEGWPVRAGQSYARAGNWSKASDCFGVAIKMSGSADLIAPYTEALLNKGDVNSAYNVLESTEKYVSQSIGLRMLRARVQAKRGLMGLAETEIVSVLSVVDPMSYDNASVFVSGVANVYPSPAEQVAALDKLEGDKPFKGYLCLKAGEIRAHQPGSRARSLDALRQLVADPNSPKQLQAMTWSLLGKLSYEDGKWEDARECFAKGLGLEPENIELNNNLAYVLCVKLNRGAEALPYAQKAVKGAPQNSGYLDTLGTCQAAMQDYPQAGQTLSAALRAGLNDGERIPVYIHLGMVKAKQMDKLEGKRLAGQARDLMENNAAAKQAYAPDLQELEKAIDGN